MRKLPANKAPTAGKKKYNFCKDFVKLNDFWVRKKVSLVVAQTQGRQDGESTTLLSNAFTL